LHLSTLAEEHEPEKLLTLSIALETVAQTIEPKRPGDPEAFAFDDDKKENATVSELREKLQPLKIVSRAKVTQNRIYSAAYHPEMSKDLIFFGGTLFLQLLSLVIDHNNR
jgi:WD repeat-containing protein 76